MGWSDCGTDSKDRPIGYSYEATCDFEGCEEEIHRGLAYACGGMHGEESNIAECADICKENTHEVCENYYCGDHKEDHECVFTKHRYLKEMEELEDD